MALSSISKGRRRRCVIRLRHSSSIRARESLGGYLTAHENSLSDALSLLCDEWKEDRARGEPVELLVSDQDGGASHWAAYLEWLMDRDRKSPGLKLNFKDASGTADSPKTERCVVKSTMTSRLPLARWKRAGAQVAIYSSGSMLAQSANCSRLARPATYSRFYRSHTLILASARSGSRRAIGES